MFGLIYESANFTVSPVSSAPSPTSRPHLDTAKPKSMVTVIDLMSKQSKSGKQVLGGPKGGLP